MECFGNSGDTGMGRSWSDHSSLMLGQSITYVRHYINYVWGNSSVHIIIIYA